MTDFGLAKLEERRGTDRHRRHRRHAAVPGPERFAGKADAAGDVYALGLTLYEMLTLRPAFDARTAWAGRADPARRRRCRPRQVDPGVAARPGDDHPQGLRPRAGPPLPDRRRAGRRPGGVPGRPAHQGQADAGLAAGGPLGETQAGRRPVAGAAAGDVRRRPVWRAGPVAAGDDTPGLRGRGLGAGEAAAPGEGRGAAGRQGRRPQERTGAGREGWRWRRRSAPVPPQRRPGRPALGQQPRRAGETAARRVPRRPPRLGVALPQPPL